MVMCPKPALRLVSDVERMRGGCYALPPHAIASGTASRPNASELANLILKRLKLLGTGVVEE